MMKERQVQLRHRIGTHKQTQADEIVIDEKNKIISTPAYMHGDAPLAKIAEGIDKCVSNVIKLI